MHSRWSRITAAMLENPDRFQAAELAEEFRKAGQKAAKFVSGTGIVYHQSIIVRAPSPTEAALASKITTGSVCDLSHWRVRKGLMKLHPLIGICSSYVAFPKCTGGLRCECARGTAAEAANRRWAVANPA